MGGWARDAINLKTNKNQWTYWAVFFKGELEHQEQFCEVKPDILTQIFFLRVSAQVKPELQKNSM